MTTRFGLLGTGNWATTLHGPGLVAHPDTELVGVWGRDPTRTKLAAEILGTSAFDNVAGLLRAVDAVAVALPPDVQADLAVQAAEADCHLLLDKPLALDVGAAARVVDAVESAGVAAVVFFTLLFRPDLEPWFEQVRGGGWSTATVTILASAFAPGSERSDSPWRKEHGALWDIGPHALSAVIPGLGPVTEVSAVSGLGDLVHLTFKHESGATSVASASLTVPPEARHHSTTYFGAGGVLPMPPSPGSAPAYGRAIDDLLLMVASGRRQHPCDVRFGRDVVRILEAAEQARRQPPEPVKLS
jgi:predicted dehydrogenase